MVSKENYGQREVEAAKSVLIELIHLLAEFKDALVIVGGSVPPLLYPDAADEYIGTTDIDLAINHKLIDDETYQTIRQALIKEVIGRTMISLLSFTGKFRRRMDILSKYR